MGIKFMLHRFTTVSNAMAVNTTPDFFDFLGKAGDGFIPDTSLEKEQKCLEKLQQQLRDLYQKSEKKSMELVTCIEDWKPKANSLNFKQYSRLSFDNELGLYNNMLHVYEILGVKVIPRTKDEVRIQFQSTQNGQFCDQYFIDITCKDSTLETPKYNLLPFIPVEKILVKHNVLSSESLHAITTEISDYLCAFNIRDAAVQTSLLMYKGNFLNSIQYSVARDMMSFILQKHDLAIECSLSYINLLAIRPDEVSVQCIDFNKIYLETWQHEFQENSCMSLAKLSLPEAINSILTSIEASFNDQSNRRITEINESSSTE